MARLSFKKSSRRRGFDPIKVPDQTQKFINESNRTLQGMQAVQGQLERNQASQLEHFKDNTRKEASMRKSQHDFSMDWQEEFNKATLRNYQTEIDNAALRTKEAEQQEKNRKDLWALIPKAVQAVGQVAAAEEKRIEGIASSIVSGMPLDLKEFDVVSKMDLSLEVTDSLQNAARNKYLKHLTSIDVKQHVGESARVMKAVKALMLTNSASQAANSIRSVLGNKDPNKPNDVCINKTLTSGNITCFSQLLNPDTKISKKERIEFKRAWIQHWRVSNGFEDIDDKFFRLHATPHLLKQWKHLDAEIEHNQIALENKDLYDGKVRSINDDINAADNKNTGTSFGRFIKRENLAGDPNLNAMLRDTYIKTVAHGVRTGQIKDPTLKTILNQEVFLGTKPLKPGETRKSSGTFREVYKDNITPILQAKEDLKKQDAEREIFEHNQVESNINAWYAQFRKVHGRRPTEAEINKGFGSHAAGTSYDITKHPLYSQNVETISVENSHKLIDIRRQMGDLTLEWLYSSPFLDDSVVAAVAPTLTDYTTNKEMQKAVFTGLSNTLSGTLDGEIADPDKRNWQTETIIEIARKAFNQRIHDALQNNAEGSYHETVVAVGTQMATEIEKGIGIFKKTNSILGEDRGFAHFQKKAYELHKEIGKKAEKAGYKFLSNKKSISKELAEEINQYALAGRHHPVIKELDRVYTRLSASTIRDKLLDNHKIKAPERNKWDRFEYYITPELRDLVNKNPSQAKTIRAVSLTAEKAGEPDPLVAILRAQEDQIANFKAQSLGIDNFEIVNGTGSDAAPATNITKTDLKDTPIDVIIQNGKLGTIKTIGPYNITPKEIEDARDAGLLSMDSLFGQREQELVKRKQLETESGTLKSWSATGSFTIPGIGQAHAFDMKPSKISKLGLDFATLKDIQMQTNELLGGDLGEQDPTLYMLATQYPWLKTGMLMDGISTVLMGAK